MRGARLSWGMSPRIAGLWLGPRLLLLVVGLGFLGCAGFRPQFLEPAVALSSVTVESLGLRGGTLELGLEVDNPNAFDIRGLALQVGIELEGVSFGEARLDHPFILPGQQTTTVLVPVRFEWAGLGAAARSALSYGEINYAMRGGATVGTPIGRRRVPFARHGRIPLTTATRGS